MTHEEKMASFREKRRRHLGMGGEEKLKARKAAGKLNARERIDYLVDPGTFQELGLFAHSDRPGMAERTPTDGKIIGSAQVRGRTVLIAANDMSILGASSAATNMKKIEHLRSLSCDRGLPLVFLGESTGARMPDCMGSLGMAQGGQNPTQYRRLREAPWIAVLLGPCYGSSAWYACMADVNIMLKGAVMAVSSPRVTEIATGENTPPEEMGGWEVHSRVTGLADAVGETEQECLDLAKEFLSRLPANARELPPAVPVPEGSGADMARVFTSLPEQQNRGYDIRRLAGTILDKGELLEIKPDFGRACVTALARLDGHSVGLIANNPLFGAGALTAECCEKITSFLVLCDSYNIPILTLVDTPGFLVGKEGEHRKITGKIINWMNALSLVTVPRLTVVIRKIYGQAYLNMGGGKLSDVFAAWPTAEISFMAPEPGINVVRGVRRSDDPDTFEALLREMARNTEPWDAAGIFGVQEVIDPRDTRQFLIRMLELHRRRLSGGLGRHLLCAWPTSY